MITKRDPAPGILCDWSVNEGRPEIQILLLLFRIAQRSKIRFDNGRRAGRLMAAPFVLPYFIYSRFCLSFDVPPSTSIGPACRIFHAHGIVINSSTVIGADVVLRHSTTLGSRRSGSDAPHIGNGVEIGAGTMILGDVKVNDGATIGAGSLVLNDVPRGAVTLAGAKARLAGSPVENPAPDDAAFGGPRG